MKRIFLIAIIAGISGFLLTGCSRNLSSTKTNYPEALQKEWKHSYEESAAGVDIYRPADYKIFTPSKFRRVYNFKANGKCEYLVLHPADAHYMANGTWNYNPETRYIQIRDEKSEQVVLLEVLEIGKDILKVQIVK